MEFAAFLWRAVHQRRRRRFVWFRVSTLSSIVTALLGYFVLGERLARIRS
jgi:hypothetical protein